MLSSISSFVFGTGIRRATTNNNNKFSKPSGISSPQLAAPRAHSEPGPASAATAGVLERQCDSAHAIIIGRPTGTANGACTRGASATTKSTAGSLVVLSPSVSAPTITIANVSGVFSAPHRAETVNTLNRSPSAPSAAITTAEHHLKTVRGRVISGARTRVDVLAGSAASKAVEFADYKAGPAAAQPAMAVPTSNVPANSAVVSTAEHPTATPIIVFSASAELSMTAADPVDNFGSLVATCPEAVPANTTAANSAAAPASACSNEPAEVDTHNAKDETGDGAEHNKFSGSLFDDLLPANSYECAESAHLQPGAGASTFAPPELANDDDDNHDDDEDEEGEMKADDKVKKGGEYVAGGDAATSASPVTSFDDLVSVGSYESAEIVHLQPGAGAFTLAPPVLDDDDDDVTGADAPLCAYPGTSSDDISSAGSYESAEIIHLQPGDGASLLAPPVLGNDPAHANAAAASSPSPASSASRCEVPAGSNESAAPLLESGAGSASPAPSTTASTSGSTLESFVLVNNNPAAAAAAATIAAADLVDVAAEPAPGQRDDSLLPKPALTEPTVLDGIIVINDAIDANASDARYSHLPGYYLPLADADGTVTMYHVRYLKRLGQGGFGRVDLIEVDLGEEKGWIPLALKRIQPSRHDGLLCPTFRREADFAEFASGLPDADKSRLATPSVVICGTRGPTGYLGFEYCPEGSLGDAMRRNGECTMDVWDALRITKQVLGALAVLHKYGWVHRDIKPDNVLIRLVHRPRQAHDPEDGHGNGDDDDDDDGTDRIEDWIEVWVADFGLADCDGPWSARAGTMIYAAPEVRNSQQYDTGVDLYSVGRMLYQLIRGRLPHFREQDDIEFGATDFEHAQFTGTYGPELVNLVRSLTAPNSGDRPTAEDAMDWVLGLEAEIVNEEVARRAQEGDVEHFVSLASPAASSISAMTPPPPSSGVVACLVQDDSLARNFQPLLATQSSGDVLPPQAPELGAVAPTLPPLPVLSGFGLPESLVVAGSSSRGGQTPSLPLPSLARLPSPSTTAATPLRPAPALSTGPLPNDGREVRMEDLPYGVAALLGFNSHCISNSISNSNSNSNSNNNSSSNSSTNSSSSSSNKSSASNEAGWRLRRAQECAFRPVLGDDDNDDTAAGVDATAAAVTTTTTTTTSDMPPTANGASVAAIVEPPTANGGSNDNLNAAAADDIPVSAGTTTTVGGPATANAGSAPTTTATAAEDEAPVPVNSATAHSSAGQTESAVGTTINPGADDNDDAAVEPASVAQATDSAQGDGVQAPTTTTNDAATTANLAASGSHTVGFGSVDNDTSSVWSAETVNVDWDDIPPWAANAYRFQRVGRFLSRRFKRSQESASAHKVKVEGDADAEAVGAAEAEAEPEAGAKSVAGPPATSSEGPRKLVRGCKLVRRLKKLVGRR